MIAVCTDTEERSNNFTFIISAVGHNFGLRVVTVDYFTCS